MRRRSCSGEMAAAFLVLSLSNPVLADLVSHWTLSEESGSTGSDSIDGIHRRIHRAEWTAGITGNALSFDGMDATVAVYAGHYMRCHVGDVRA